VGPDGALYVSHHGGSPAFVAGVYTPVGEVLRIDDGHGDAHGHHGHGDHEDEDHDHE